LLVPAWGCDTGYLEPAWVERLDNPVDQGALPGRTQPFDDDKNGYTMLLTFSLEVSELVALFLNLLEQGLAGLGWVFHRPGK